MRPSIRIVQTDNGSFPPLFNAAARRRFECSLRLIDTKSEQETLAACRDAHLVLATRGRFTRDVLKEMKECAAIVRFGVGVENIDLDQATREGIIVANVPDFCVDEVSETVCASILALNRKTHSMHRSVLDGKWDRRLAIPIGRLRNRTLGLIGFGRIARAVAARMKAFGMHIVAFDPYVREQDMRRAGVMAAGFDQLLEHSDFISLHVPMRADTRGLIGARELRKMKKGAYLINTSRGKIIDEKALYRALKEGVIGGAALDVLEDEPPARTNPLFKLDNVILTPHYASYSEEAFEELQEKVREAAIAVLQGRRPDNIVNPAVRDKLRRLV